MKTNKKARVYNSPIVDSILSNISKEELEITEGKMRLAMKIADAIKAKGFDKKSDFAKKLKKQNSEISKWLSGTHNFTTETLILLQNELDINLINSEIEPKVELKDLHLETIAQNKSNSFNLSSLFNFQKPDFVQKYSFCPI
ncbi:MAG: helix-turn-helix domain-containing protein [Flavobacterium sp.]|nr:helix-turn-helix domain-containing protein [Flavobacterium sp.]